MKNDGYAARHSQTSRKRKQEKLYKLPRPDLLTADGVISSFGVGTSIVVLATPFDPLLKASTGQLATYPSVMEPYMAGLSAVYDFKGKVRVERLLITLNLVGSQSNTIAAGDLYNRVRVILIYTNSNYLGTVAFNTFTIDTQPDMRDAQILYDQVHNLPSQAFDTVNSYNVPQCKTLKINAYQNRNFELFSTQGGATWDTRRGNYILYIVSDSAVAPNPLVSGSTRLLYRRY